MAEINIEAQTIVNPTESEEKVRSAISNIFDNVSFAVQTEGKQSSLIAQAKGRDSLMKLRTLLRQDRIRDASRKALLHSIHGETISFYLNKQVAAAGHISFSQQTAESPLGPIQVTITTENPRQLIEWVAEKTER
jgi:predicted RNA binding protein with dsRBD fold (UPF0201 family)